MYNNNVFIRHFYYDKLTHQTRIHAKKRRGVAWRPGSRQIEAITEYTVVSTERQFAIDTLGHYAADAAARTATSQRSYRTYHSQAQVIILQTCPLMRKAT